MNEPAAAPPCAATLAAVAVAGAGVMSVELAAVRLLAPWFGTSSGVWTNVIGVILLALSVGYLLGARTAAGPRPLGRLVTFLGLGGALVLLLPFLAAPVAELFLPAGLSLDQAAGVSTWGSLAAAGLLFLLPAVLLGAVGPLAVELVQVRSSVHAGTAGGQVLCVSTLGSLAGTFATTHLFLPELGTRWTFLGAGLALVGSATLLGLGGRRAGSSAALWVAWVIAAAGLALPARSRPVAAPWRWLAERDSAYQALRVVETGAGERRERLLQVNEGLDSYQSVWRPSPGLLGPGYYYDYLALPLAWPGPDHRRVLVLGLGAGTVFRVLEGALPPGRSLELTGVELDPAVVALGRTWFELLEGEQRRVVIADARVGLAASAGRFDLVVLDCYTNQSEIPPHLATLEFFGQVRGRLAPQGVLAINVGGFGRDDPVVAAVARTLAGAFDGRVLGARVPSARNWVLYAFAGEVSDPLAFDGDQAGPLADLLPPLRLPGALERFDATGGPPLTDERAPLAELQRASLERGRRGQVGDA